MNRFLRRSMFGCVLVLAACVTTLNFPAEEGVRTADRVIDYVLGASVVTSSGIAIDSPESLRLQESMKTRVEQLRPYYDSGDVGFSEDGYVAVTERGSASVVERNKLRVLVANENADRAALYREIARANRQPQWEGKLRNSFANRWTAKAMESGWYHQDGGSWSR